MYALNVSYNYLINNICDGGIVLANTAFDKLIGECLDNGEVVNGYGFFEYHSPEDEDYTYWCDFYGYDPDDQEEIEIENDFYQYFIIDNYTKQSLQEYTDETIFEFPEFDLNFLAVGHYGTAWSCVSVELKKPVYVGNWLNTYTNLCTSEKIRYLDYNMEQLKEYDKNHGTDFYKSSLDEYKSIKAKLEAQLKEQYQ